MSLNGWNIADQDKGKYLFMELKKQFGLRPDIVMPMEYRIIILDTKWKKLVNNINKNYGI